MRVRLTATTCLSCGFSLRYHNVAFHKTGANTRLRVVTPKISRYTYNTQQGALTVKLLTYLVCYCSCITLVTGVLLLAFCTSFQRGEGRNGRVRNGWGHIRFWLTFAGFLTCTIAPDWHCVYST